MTTLLRTESVLNDRNSFIIFLKLGRQKRTELKIKVILKPCVQNLFTLQYEYCLRRTCNFPVMLSAAVPRQKHAAKVSLSFSLGN